MKAYLLLLQQEAKTHLYPFNWLVVGSIGIKMQSSGDSPHNLQWSRNTLNKATAASPTTLYTFVIKN